MSHFLRKIISLFLILLSSIQAQSDTGMNTVVKLNLMQASSSFNLVNFNSINAFNVFDADTFSNSSCQILLMEPPSGLFVDVNGNSNASGTQQDPLDLHTALSAKSPVQAGQTLWINGGIYTGSFVSELRGTNAQFIKVKPMPGQRVILDGKISDLSTLRINGQWTEYYGLEIVSSSTRRTSTQRGSNPTDLIPMIFESA